MPLRRCDALRPDRRNRLRTTEPVPRPRSSGRDNGQVGRPRQREPGCDAGVWGERRIHIELHVRRQLHRLEDRVIVIEFTHPFRTARGRAGDRRIGLVPSEADPGLIEPVALIPPNATDVSILFASPEALLARRNRPYLAFKFCTALKETPCDALGCCGTAG